MYPIFDNVTQNLYLEVKMVPGIEYFLSWKLFVVIKNRYLFVVIVIL